MKKQLLLLSFVLLTLSVCSQNSIPNGDFELWQSGISEAPLYYPVNSNAQNFFRFNLPFNVTKTTDAYHGNYAVQLTTNANSTDTSVAYFVNDSPDGDPSSWVGGIPISEKPNGIRGYYKYNVANTDSATFIVTFSKAGVNIGSYIYLLNGIQSSYTLFDFTFNPPLSQIPDSFIIAALSCNLNNAQQQGPGGPAGSTLILDSVSLKGITSQPIQMNGDFELWQNQTFEVPDSWYTETEIGEGLAKTNDANSGSYAIELQTYLGNQNSQPVARSGRISTGYYPNNCNGNCNQQGGYPYSNQIDTLTFFYKYFPSGSDTAIVQLNFKNNHINFWGNSIELFASSSYQYIEFPFSLPQAPDSTIISIYSSNWQDTLLSFVGSSLIIDELHFKSQPLGTNIMSNFINNNIITLYPNPFRSTVTIEINSKIDVLGTELMIIDLTGKEVKTIPVDKYKIIVNKDELKSGLYLYELRKSNKTLNSGKFIIE
ncbi:MAG: T9SS type A sorting domain-containing protein [Bacteroidia bacterium]|nr:T9SS type A sorting domain-containing protein [Bacteroidia bacterium]